MRLLSIFTWVWLVAPCNSYLHNPWQSNCKTPGDDNPGCVVSDRDSLPTVRTDVEWTITYMRTLFQRNKQLLPNARLYHGAVLVSAVGASETFLIQYIVYQFGPNIALPVLPTEDGFKWDNTAVVTWYPSWIRSPDDYFDSIWPLGHVSGSIVNRWLDDVPRWAAAHTGYRLVSQWSGPNVAQAEMYVEDSTCQSFCEYSFKTLYEAGAKFDENPAGPEGAKFPLCRNYAPVITETPQIVDISNAAEHVEAEGWYGSAALCAVHWFFTGTLCKEAFAKQEFAFVTDAANNYYKGALKQPYFAGWADDHYIEQRMLLPWQNYDVDTKLGECHFPEHQTSLTRDMNALIARGMHGVYTGGPGVLVRSPFDGLTENYKVTPATFWVNDVFAPSQLYPTTGGGIGCPNNGTDGFLTVDPCEKGPWEYAQMAILAGYSVQKFFPHWDTIQNSDWNYGVFYPTDGNTVDKRCRWLEDDKAYDCPGGWLPLGGEFEAMKDKIGTGGYEAGNPLTGAGGGGAGCHFEKKGGKIDQTNAETEFHEGLVMNYHCQCNKAFNKDWNQWVDNWILHAKPKAGFEYQGWFKKDAEPKAPSWSVDIAACWVDNPRDMIQLQNALWWRRHDWSNQMLPMSNWQGAKDPASNRPYWGWNEVPVDRIMINDPGNWDAVLIKLPAGLCGKTGSNDDSIACLGKDAQWALEKDFDKWVNAGYLLLGGEKYSWKPGSSVVLVREIMDFNGNYQKEFFCQDWTSPGKKYGIVFLSDLGPAPEGTGACYAESRSSTIAYV